MAKIEANQFIVTSYNILDPELESNFIPKTMDSDLIKELQKITINEELKPITIKSITISNLYELLNYIFTNYFLKLSKRKDFKKQSNEMEVISMNTEQFINKLNFDNFFIKNNIINIIKLLNNNINNNININTTDEKLNTIYYKIINQNENRIWTNRCEHICTEIVKNNPDIICLQEYGASHFLKDKNNKTICEFLNGKDYNALFFLNKNGIKDSNDYQGVAIYYNRNTFQLNDNDNHIHIHNIIIYPTDETKNIDKLKPPPANTEVKESDIYIGAHNVDYTENKNYTKYRTAGFAILKHKHTQKNILFINTHLQSPTNDIDCSIRSVALKNIKKTINDILENTKKLNINIYQIVFCGDLNLDLNTDLQRQDIIINKNENNITMIINDNMTLMQQYTNNNYTTYNNEDGYKYIDYILSNKPGTSETTYITKNESHQSDPELGIINETHPSDHIPVTFKFTIDKLDFKKKYLKYKQKYLKQKSLYF